MITKIFFHAHFLTFISLLKQKGKTDCVKNVTSILNHSNYAFSLQKTEVLFQQGSSSVHFMETAQTHVRGCTDIW